MSMQTEREPGAPSPASLQAIERTAESVRAHYAQRRELLQDYVRTHRVRLAFDLDLLTKRVPPGATVLDVGCTPLLLSGAASQAGFRVIGVDINPEPFAAAAGALNLEVRRCDIEEDRLPVDSESIDAVVFNEVFGHLRINPIFTVSELHRVLRPTGTLFLSTPNLRSLRGIINFLFRDQAHSSCGNVYAQYRMIEELGHMGHTREYTATEVRRFLEQLGFQIDAQVFRGSFHHPAARPLLKVFPSLRPFMSMICSRVAGHPANSVERRSTVEACGSQA